MKKSIYFLDTYFPSLVDTIISSLSSINKGTFTSIPVSMVASLVALVAVFPLMAGEDNNNTLIYSAKENIDRVELLESIWPKSSQLMLYVHPTPRQYLLMLEDFTSRYTQ